MRESIKILWVLEETLRLLIFLSIDIVLSSFSTYETTFIYTFPVVDIHRSNLIFIVKKSL